MYFYQFSKKLRFIKKSKKKIFMQSGIYKVKKVFLKKTLLNVSFIMKRTKNLNVQLSKTDVQEKK